MLMYAKVFAQIFDSSIADDYHLRHFFMDMLVLADENGVVDMTPAAIAGRTRIPIAGVKKFLEALESPDPESRTAAHEGRRIFRLDVHRSWGWGITNYSRFRDIAKEQQRKESTRKAVRRFREKQIPMELPDNEACNAMKSNVSTPYVYASASVSASEDLSNTQGRFKKPTLEAVKLQCAKIGLPESEAGRFVDYYESNGWKVGRNPMKLWTGALANWKRNWQDRQPKSYEQRNAERSAL